MYQVNAWGFYLLSTLLRPVCKVKEGAKYADDNESGLTLAIGRSAIKKVIEGKATAEFEGDTLVPLPRSVHYAERLANELEALHETLRRSDDRAVSVSESANITVKLVQFEDALKHELEHAPIFYIPQIGTHSVQDLLEHAERNLPNDVVSRLSSECVQDIQQSGRCLVVDASTAAGFHILRAVESLVLAYVDKITTKAHPKINRDWGSYIRVIRNTPNARPAVADYLYHMKETYRNPIMHPEVRLTADEAFALFNASLSAIVQLDAAIEAWP